MLASAAPIAAEHRPALHRPSLRIPGQDASSSRFLSRSVRSSQAAHKAVCLGSVVTAPILLFARGRSPKLRVAGSVQSRGSRIPRCGKSASSARSEARAKGLGEIKPGIQGEDNKTRLRELGLGQIEVLGALLLGPLAACIYPSLRHAAASFLDQGEPSCESVWAFCADVPDGLNALVRRSLRFLFSSLLGYTFFFLVSKQESLYIAMYKEMAILQRIVEEVLLLLPPDVAQDLLRGVRKYLQSGWWRNPRLLPVELNVRTLRSDKDPFEAMTRMLMSRDRDLSDDRLRRGCWEMLDAIRSLRSARAQRLAAMQQVIPILQFVSLSIVAVLFMMPPFMVGRSEISGLEQLLFGCIVEVQAIVLLAVKDASATSGSIYSTCKERSALVAALEEQIARVEAECARELELNK